MTIQSWITEKKKLAEDATPGPWETTEILLGDTGQWAALSGPKRHSKWMKHLIPERDAAFTADARSSLPKALAALEYHAQFKGMNGPAKTALSDIQRILGEA